MSYVMPNGRVQSIRIGKRMSLDNKPDPIHPRASMRSMHANTNKVVVSLNPDMNHAERKRSSSTDHKMVGKSIEMAKL